VSLGANKINKKLLEIRQVRGIDEKAEVECTYQGETDSDQEVNHSRYHPDFPSL
jgi:hypothetical protein